MDRKNYYISFLVLIGILFATVEVQAAPKKHRGNSHVVVIGPRPRSRASVVPGPRPWSRASIVRGPRFRSRASVVTPISARYRYPHRSGLFITLPRITILPKPAPVVHVPAISVTVWVTNSNGSRSPVLLTQEGPWYIGPRGERYFGVPTEEQLRPLYGLNIEPIQPTELTIYIAASNGVLIPVKLIANEDGFIGPRGELYRSMPTEKQLRMVYGR
jgi:hypothetical protein